MPVHCGGFFSFSVLGEEWGLFGTLMVIAMLILFAWRGFGIASRAADPFGKMVAAGLTTIEHLLRPGVYEDLEEKGAEVEQAEVAHVVELAAEDRVEPVEDPADAGDQVLGLLEGLQRLAPLRVHLGVPGPERLDAQALPTLALEAGDDGMDVVSRILAGAADYLRPGGIMVVEVGASADLLRAR